MSICTLFAIMRSAPCASFRRCRVLTLGCSEASMTMLHGNAVKDGNSFGHVDETRQRHAACRVLGDKPPRPPYRVYARIFLTHGLLQAVKTERRVVLGLEKG